MAGRHLLGIHLHLRCMTWVVPLVILFRPTPAKRNNPRAAYVFTTNREIGFAPLSQLGTTRTEPETASCEVHTVSASVVPISGSHAEIGPVYWADNPLGPSGRCLIIGSSLPRQATRSIEPMREQLRCLNLRGSYVRLILVRARHWLCRRRASSRNNLCRKFVALAPIRASLLPPTILPVLEDTRASG